VYSAGASISGTVTNFDGKPITTEDACVQAYQPVGAAGHGFVAGRSAQMCHRVA